MLIMILRRSRLDADELAALTVKFPDTEFEFVAANPADYGEHAVLCDKLQPDLVFLPRYPIPSLAMEKGYKHVTARNGELMELLALGPAFAPLSFS